MKLVYTHENRFLVANAQNLLEQAGIQVLWKNEFASGALGELSAFDTWPELWLLDEADYSRAQAILNQTLANTSAQQWLCPRCQEPNEPAFEHCWSCQTERPSTEPEG